MVNIPDDIGAYTELLYIWRVGMCNRIRVGPVEHKRSMTLVVRNRAIKHPNFIWYFTKTFINLILCVNFMDSIYFESGYFNLSASNCLIDNIPRFGPSVQRTWAKASRALQSSPMQTVMVVRLFSVLIITARCWYKSQYRLPSINCQAQGHLSTPVKFINLREASEIEVVRIWP